MPRGSATQTRTFNYNSGTTVTGFLQSATNPENGTVSYTYNTNNLLASKTDAKSQKLTYQYDTYNRLTSVTWTNPPQGGAQVLRTYYYDSNPLDTTGFSQYTAGRLAAVKYLGAGTGGIVQINEMYSYTQPYAQGTDPEVYGGGLPSAKRLQVNEYMTYQNVQGRNENATVTGNLDTTFAYNAEGGLISTTYPSGTTASNGTIITTPGPSYNYSYDSMYRLSGMTDSNYNTIVSGVSYNAANQLLSINYPGNNETRSYNVLNQLTNVTAGSENLTYHYPTGANNGKVSSMYNAVSGETVTYTYDSLNRLLTVNGSGWGDQYGFDPFGNLLSKTVTAGSAPSMSISVNAANNQIQGIGLTYDANGNTTTNFNGGVANTLTYDAENRVSTYQPYIGLTTTYAYDTQNHRIWSWPGTTDTWGNVSGYTVNIYTPGGQKLAAYTVAPAVNDYNGQATPFMASGVITSDQYFGGRRLAPMDQLGSVGTYFPWGENKGSTNPQDTWSFATYWQDSVSGLDYANNRYYSNAYGRFMTPDPSTNGGRVSEPQNWNRYAYAGADPVNHLDPSGLDFIWAPIPDDGGGSGGGGDFCGGFADGDASSQSPGDGCGPPSGPCVASDGFTPSPSPWCQTPGVPVGAPQPPQQPTPQQPAPPPPIYCEPDVIAAMKKAWAQSGNGTSGQEAGFSVNGSPAPGAYSITSTGAYSTNVTCQANITYTPGSTFAIFHVHPNNCLPELSQTDINAANAGNFDIYAFSKSGLYEYDPTTKQTVMLRSGMSWTQPCPTD